MANQLLPRIVGTGYAVPVATRTNDDPIFSWLHSNPPPNNPFAGYNERSVLGPGEDVVTVMKAASQNALKAANVQAIDVDMLLGSASIGSFKTPNQLSQLHRDLKLPASAWAVPLANDFSNFNSSILMADALIRAGRAKTILVCVGSDWTRNVDYHTPQSVSAGDGAGAAVLQASDDATKFWVKDQCTLMATEYFGGMFSGSMPVIKADFMSPIQLNTPEPVHFAPFPKGDVNYRILGYDSLFTYSFFNILPLGLEGFKNFAIPTAANSALTLLSRNNLKSSAITFFPHQSTQVLIDVWNKAIQPAQEIDTITKFGNLGIATEALNLAWAIEQKSIAYNNVVMMAMGDDIHVNSVLLTREQSG